MTTKLMESPSTSSSPCEDLPQQWPQNLNQHTEISLHENCQQDAPQSQHHYSMATQNDTTLNGNCQERYESQSIHRQDYALQSFYPDSVTPYNVDCQPSIATQSHNETGQRDYATLSLHQQSVSSYNDTGQRDYTTQGLHRQSVASYNDTGQRDYATPSLHHPSVATHDKNCQEGYAFQSLHSQEYVTQGSHRQDHSTQNLHHQGYATQNLHSLESASQALYPNQNPGAPHNKNIQQDYGRQSLQCQQNYGAQVPKNGFYSILDFLPRNSSTAAPLVQSGPSWPQPNISHSTYSKALSRELSWCQPTEYSDRLSYVSAPSRRRMQHSNWSTPTPAELPPWYHETDLRSEKTGISDGLICSPTYSCNYGQPSLRASGNTPNNGNVNNDQTENQGQSECQGQSEGQVQLRGSTPLPSISSFYSILSAKGGLENVYPNDQRTADSGSNHGQFAPIPNMNDHPAPCIAGDSSWSASMWPRSRAPVPAPVFQPVVPRCPCIDCIGSHSSSVHHQGPYQIHHHHSRPGSAIERTQQLSSMASPTLIQPEGPSMNSLLLMAAPSRNLPQPLRSRTDVPADHSSQPLNLSIHPNANWSMAHLSILRLQNKQGSRVSVPNGPRFGVSRLPFDSGGTDLYQTIATQGNNFQRCSPNGEGNMEVDLGDQLSDGNTLMRRPFGNSDCDNMPNEYSNKSVDKALSNPNCLPQEFFEAMDIQGHTFDNDGKAGTIHGLKSKNIPGEKSATLTRLMSYMATNEAPVEQACLSLTEDLVSCESSNGHQYFNREAISTPASLCNMQDMYDTETVSTYTIQSSPASSRNEIESCPSEDPNANSSFQDVQSCWLSAENSQDQLDFSASDQDPVLNTASKSTDMLSQALQEVCGLSSERLHANKPTVLPSCPAGQSESESQPVLTLEIPEELNHQESLSPITYPHQRRSESRCETPLLTTPPIEQSYMDKAEEQDFIMESDGRHVIEMKNALESNLLSKMSEASACRKRKHCVTVTTSSTGSMTYAKMKVKGPLMLDMFCRPVGSSTPKPAPKITQASDENAADSLKAQRQGNLGVFSQIWDSAYSSSSSEQSSQNKRDERKCLAGPVVHVLSDPKNNSLGGAAKSVSNTIGNNAPQQRSASAQEFKVTGKTVKQLLEEKLSRDESNSGASDERKFHVTPYVKKSTPSTYTAKGAVDLAFVAGSFHAERQQGGSQQHGESSIEAHYNETGSAGPKKCEVYSLHCRKARTSTSSPGPSSHSSEAEKTRGRPMGASSNGRIGERWQASSPVGPGSFDHAHSKPPPEHSWSSNSNMPKKAPESSKPMQGTSSSEVDSSDSRDTWQKFVAMVQERNQAADRKEAAAKVAANSTSDNSSPLNKLISLTSSTAPPVPGSQASKIFPPPVTDSNGAGKPCAVFLNQAHPNNPGGMFLINRSAGAASSSQRIGRPSDPALGSYVSHSETLIGQPQAYTALLPPPSSETESVKMQSNRNQTSPPTTSAAPCQAPQELQNPVQFFRSPMNARPIQPRPPRMSSMSPMWRSVQFCATQNTPSGSRGQYFPTANAVYPIEPNYRPVG